MSYDLVGSWLVESRYPQGMLATTAGFTSTEDGVRGTWNESFGDSGAATAIPDQRVDAKRGVGFIQDQNRERPGVVLDTLLDGPI
jgi:hypothetical protein